MEIHTIGLTQTTAARFFGRLKRGGHPAAGRRAAQQRSRNSPVSRSETTWSTFCRKSAGLNMCICRCWPRRQEILDAFKKQKGSWEEYEGQLIHSLAERQIETVAPSAICSHVPTVLLCSEPTVEHCHRRLVIGLPRQHLGQRAGDSCEVQP